LNRKKRDAIFTPLPDPLPQLALPQYEKTGILKERRGGRAEAKNFFEERF